MRISLRELLIVVAVAAVGMAGLKYASGGMRTVVQLLTGLVLLAIVIKAAVDRGSGQAFAIGFAVSAVLYLVVAVVAQHSTVLYSSTGMFGTDDVLRGLHKVFVYQFWVQEDTGEIAADFHPNNAGEIYAGAAQRLVLAEIPPDVGEAGDSKPSSSASAPGGTTSGNAGTGTLRGRGRRGFNPARRVPPQLTPEQVDEFQAVSPERQQEIVDMFRDDPQAVKAIQSGRPLSTVQYVKYVRRDEPLLDDFLKVGFCLWALVIGYGGGCFARYVYGRRMKTSNN